MLWPLAREGGEDGAKTYSDDVDVDAAFSSSSGRLAWEAVGVGLRFEKRPMADYGIREDIEQTTNGLRWSSLVVFVAVGASDDDDDDDG